MAATWRRIGGRHFSGYLEESDEGHSGRNCEGNVDESEKFSSVAGWGVLDFEGFEGELTFIGKVKYSYTVSTKFTVSFTVGWNIDWLWKGDSDCSGCQAEEASIGSACRGVAYLSFSPFSAEL